MARTAALVPSTAPFSSEQISALNSVVANTTPAQRHWLSGFLAGLEAANGSQQVVAPVAQPLEKTPLTILYASESGNAEGLANAAKKVASKQGFDARVHDMADVDASILGKAKNVLVYAATWGEGDPPQRAIEFYNSLMGDAAPKLDGVRFAVLALGDSSYVDFCETGKRIDARLEELGGIRAVDRIDLDLDFAKAAKAWTDQTLETLRPADSDRNVVHVDFHGALDAASDVEGFTEENPLEAEIIERVNLNGTGSTRETWHVELATDVPGFIYAPGDSIGVVAENDPEMVDAVISASGVTADDALRNHLLRSADVTTLSRPVVQKYAALTGRDDVRTLADDVDAFKAFAADRQLVDLFEMFPEKLDADQLKGLLRPLPSRLYSVASSPIAHAGEAHLLVGAVRWHSHGHERRGVASTYLADRRTNGESLKVYVKPNRHFKLPTEAERPIIMIGAGTGVAPYRGFVAERAELGAPGKNWLIFGERNYTNDFLYQLEWQEHLEAGVLTYLDVAFSRDQPEKIYVQHRLWEKRDQVLGWIRDGANIYVCGDEKGMARDVDGTLARILGEASGADAEAGRAELSALAKAGRYQRDVY